MIFTLVVTEADVAVLSDALGAMPYARVSDLAVKLQGQITAQNIAAFNAARAEAVDAAVAAALQTEREKVKQAEFNRVHAVVLDVKPEQQPSLNGGTAPAGEAAQGT